MVLRYFGRPSVDTGNDDLASYQTTPVEDNERRHVALQLERLLLFQ
jgi:hypothetical protein